MIQPGPVHPRARVVLRRFRATAGIALALALAGVPGAAAALDAGAQAPPLSAPKLTGPGKVSLEQYRGKVVYVDFWASWCAPCVTGMPLIDELRKEFDPEDFAVVGVNVDGEPRRARRLLERRPVGYPSVSDPSGRLPERFGLETMPTSYLIDRDGVVRYVHEGFRKSDVEVLRGKIRGLVGKGDR